MTRRRKRRHESGTPQKEEEEGETEELKAFIEEKTGDAVKEIKKALDQRIRGIEDSLNFAYESITVTSQKVTTLEQAMKDIYEEWGEMKSRVAQLEQHGEEMEKLRRRPQLIFTGSDLVIPSSDEGLMPAVTAFIDRVLELEVPPGEILQVNRLSRKRLLVKFARDERGSLRDRVFRSKYKLKGQKIFINENLTPMRQAALTRLLREKKRLSTVHTSGGEVLFAVSRDDDLIRVRSAAEAEHVLQMLQIGSSAPAAPHPTVPGIAPAPVQSGSRDPGRAAEQPVNADSPMHTESAGAGESRAAAPVLGDDRPLAGRSEAPAAPTLPESDTRADRRDGVVTGEAQQHQTPSSAAGLNARGLDSDREVAQCSSLAPPLPELTDTCGPRDGGTDSRLTEEGRGEGAAGGPSEPSEVTAQATDQAEPSSPQPVTEVREVENGVTGHGRGKESEESASLAQGRGGGERWDSSVSGHGSGRGASGESGKNERQISAAGVTGQQGIAGFQSRPAGGANRSGSMGDIRSFFK